MKVLEYKLYCLLEQSNFSTFFVDVYMRGNIFFSGYHGNTLVKSKCRHGSYGGHIWET